MLCVLWFKRIPEGTSKLLELWKELKYPEDVKLIDISLKQYLML